SQRNNVRIGAQQNAEVAEERAYASDRFREILAQLETIASFHDARYRKILRNCALTATGPAPGPPPPWGVENVLCKFIWSTSTPMPPGLATPISALRFAPPK